MAFVVVAFPHHLTEFFHVLLVDGAAFGFNILAAHRLQNEPGRVAGHHGRSSPHVGEGEPRLERPAAHAVVGRAVIRSDDVRDFRRFQAGAGPDHVGAVFADAAPFFGLADHVAGRSLQEQNGKFGIAAADHPFRRFAGRFNINDAVGVGGDHADGDSLEPHFAADDRTAAARAIR